MLTSSTNNINDTALLEHDVVFNMDNIIKGPKLILFLNCSFVRWRLHHLYIYIFIYIIIKC